MSEDEPPRIGLDRFDPIRLHGWYAHGQLADSYRGTSPLKTGDYVIAAAPMICAWWLCFIPWFGLLALPIVLRWAHRITGRRVASGEVKAWPRKPFIVGLTMWLSGVQVIAMLLSIHFAMDEIMLPLVAFIMLGFLIMGFGSSYLNHRDGPMRLSTKDEYF